ncbi:Radical SAM domain-containing protein [Desulfonema limicola]|uniref:Radical SAM domain-containing protein n=1 Tax=Desulfonema limicola TaxID=45656 RepID=A0A975BD70_9BACT|nr:radical SAM protein [Desulfonema limicola]QTA83019.1 Radical SAM domain-containing protein [Desulfonema limicola]
MKIININDFTKHTKNSITKKALKFHNLTNAYINSHLHSTPAFIRIIPTDRCNLNCRYCWQKNDDSKDMTFNNFCNYLDKAKSLNAGMITFLGGEPMIWKPIYNAVSLCSEKNILTDLTTNGTLLNQETIERFGKAGLDYLNISVDVVNKSQISSKNSIFNNNLVNYLKDAKAKYGMHFRLNSVICNNNFDDIKRILEFVKLNDIQISLGYVVPPLNNSHSKSQSIYFGKEDTRLLNKIISYILEKKRDGYPVIDPDSYFTNIFRFFNHEKFWDCNYPTRYGWINVTTNGKIRSCTKKMDELDFNFLDLNPENLKKLRSIFKDKVKKCNTTCYSNCAYNSYYYTHNKFKMLKKSLGRFNFQMAA